MAIHAAVGWAALLGLVSPALAGDGRLALALGVLASVDGHEDRLQREGLARALLAFLTGKLVALYAFEWSNPSHQVTVLPGLQEPRCLASVRFG